MEEKDKLNGMARRIIAAVIVFIDMGFRPAESAYEACPGHERRQGDTSLGSRNRCPWSAKTGSLTAAIDPVWLWKTRSLSKSKLSNGSLPCMTPNGFHILKNGLKRIV
jgi:hypothetical protein